MSVTELELSLTGKVCIITGAAGGIGKGSVTTNG